MTLPIRCPFCASERVYTLMDTRHCKRCKGMWHENKKSRDLPDRSGSGARTALLKARGKPRTETLSMRLKKELDTCLKRHHGKICPDRMGRDSGSLAAHWFRLYIRICVKNGELTGKKDRHGTIWYSREG